MTIQQLQYIIAVDSHRNFAKAADECGVTQPTLSSMIKKLEDELDIRIFERTNRHVETTSVGRRIVGQARKTVMEAARINEIVNETKNEISGSLRISVGPCIAPYILPKFIRHYSFDNPQVTLSVEEMRVEAILDSLSLNQTDIGIAVGGKSRQDIFEIPLYTERFWVYVAGECARKLTAFRLEDLSHENMWIMKEAQCQRESAFSFCKTREYGKRIYEAGNIDTLVRIVDENGGFTIIPQMHLPFLSPRQQANVRPLDGDKASFRKISLYIRSDYVREKMLNTVASTFLKFMPEEMIEPAIKKFGIRL